LEGVGSLYLPSAATYITRNIHFYDENANDEFETVIE
jgi:hypothetical protein